MWSSGDGVFAIWGIQQIESSVEREFMRWGS